MIKRFLSFLLLISCLMLNGTVSLAASRKGVQLILLSRWSQTSRENFLNVATQPNAPRDIEIAFVPYFNRSNPYGNAQYIVDRLLAAGKNVTVAVHLSFHTATDYQLQSDAWNFNVLFFKPYAHRVVFKIVPSLEDQWSYRDFKRKSEIVLKQLDRALLGTGRHQLRRSPDPNPIFPGMRESLPPSLTVNGISVLLQKEAHWTFENATGFNAYSNDGILVYADFRFSNGQRETTATADNASGAPSTKYPLSTFTTRANSFPNAVLLWRPAYNLFQKRVENGVVKFSKVGPPETRPDYDSAPAFDSNEQEVLRRFWGM